MNCLLCGKSYPDSQAECYACNNNLATIKPYSPHLSQIIRMSEGVCGSEFDPNILEKAIRNLIKRLDKAEDQYFEYEAQYTPQDKIILEEYLSNILDQSEFLRKNLEDLIHSARSVDIKGIYNCLDKARIAEKLFLSAVKKLNDLKEEDLVALEKEKGIQKK